MAFFRIALAAAPLVHALVSNPFELDPENEAMRARQYAKLYMKIDTEPALASLLTLGVEERRGLVDVKYKFMSDLQVGQAASLDSRGFAAVAARRSSAAMGAFLYRYLDSEGLKVTDKSFMEHVVPYYTGECANQTFMALIAEAHQGQKAKACHPAWVADKRSASTNSDDGSSWPRTQRNMDKAAVHLIRGIAAELGAHIEQGKWRFFNNFAWEHYQSDKTLQQLKEALAQRKVVKNWGHMGKAVAQPTFVAKGRMHDWMKYIGSAAPLNDFGYQAVVYARSDGQMSAYIRRVAKHMGLNIANEDGLHGMTPYYSGECAKQSYDALVKELASIAGHQYKSEVSMKFDATKFPTFEEMIRSVAQGAGVDANQVEMHPADKAKYAKYFKKPDNQRQKPPAPRGPPPKARRPAHEQPLQLRFTISVHSKAAVKELAKKLKIEPIPGASRVLLTKTEHHTSTKPKVCGGGVVSAA